MGKFRERMDQDMQVRGYSLNTRKVYLSCVHDFVGYYKRPPDELVGRTVSLVASFPERGPRCGALAQPSPASLRTGARVLGVRRNRLSRLKKETAPTRARRARSSDSAPPGRRSGGHGVES